MINSKILFYLIFFCLSYVNCFAQADVSNWKYIYVREDNVKPFMVDDYEKALFDFNTMLSDNDVKNYNSFTHLLDNFSFVHLIPLNKLENIEEGTVEFLENKVKDDSFNLLYSKINETIDASYNYILKYREDLSYVPDSSKWGVDTPYRRWNYLYFLPGSETEIELLLSSWKNLYKQNDIKMGFRIFTGFVGTDKPLYIITTWAANPFDYQTNLGIVMDALGENGAALWSETMSYVREVDTIEGWFLPQYSYPIKK